MEEGMEERTNIVQLLCNFLHFQTNSILVYLCQTIIVCQMNEQI